MQLTHQIYIPLLFHPPFRIYESPHHSHGQSSAGHKALTHVTTIYTKEASIG